MKTLRALWKRHLASALVLVALLSSLSIAHAHLMPAQHGTLNFVDDGAFMVLSLPVSAFSGVDENGDGQWSLIEFNAHRAQIIETVNREVRLSDEQGLRPLRGVMLLPVLVEDDPTGMATQVMALGRFDLAGKDTLSPLHLEINIFGTESAGKMLRLTTTRHSSDQKHVLVLTPANPGGALFPSSWQILLDYTELGALHIITGLDHLLFLLVVLATGWSWRYVFLTLTTFSIGHAISLMVSVRGELSVSAGIVEPAIAATIVGMALFDVLARRYKWPPSLLLRLSLTFTCSLVHGLGLSSSLAELGLDQQHQLPSLAGFNIGIELGQLAFALVAGTLVLSLHRWRGESAVMLATGAGSFAAVAIGSVWFLQRVFV